MPQSDNPASPFSELRNILGQYHIAVVASVILATLLLFGQGDLDPVVRRYVIPALALYAVGAGNIGYFQKLAFERHAKKNISRPDVGTNVSGLPFLPDKIIWGIFVPLQMLLFVGLVIYCIIHL